MAVDVEKHQEQRADFSAPPEETMGTKPHRAAGLGLLGSVLTTAAAVVSTLVVPRLLGPAYYGAFATFLAFRETVQGLSRLGLASALARYRPLWQHRGGWKNTVGTLLLVQLVLAVLLTTISLPLLRAALGRWGTSGVLGLAAVQMLLGSALAFMVSLTYARNLITTYTAVTVLGASIGPVLVPILFLAWGFIGAVAAGLVGNFVLWLFLLRTARPWPIARPGKEAVKSALVVLCYAAQVFGGALIGLLLIRGGVFILAAAGQPHEQIGLFAAGFNPAVKLVGIVLGPSGMLLPALAAHAAAGNTAKLKEWGCAQARYTVALAMVAIAFMGFIGTPLLRAVLGSKYSGVESVVCLASLLIVPLAAGALARRIAVGMGFARLQLETLVIFAPVLVGGGWLLAHRYGLHGLLVAMLVACAVAALYSNMRMRIWSGFWPLGTSWIPIMFLGAPAVLGFLLQGSWSSKILLFALFCFAYLAGLVALELTPAEELKDFWLQVRERRGGSQ